MHSGLYTERGGRQGALWDPTPPPPPPKNSIYMYSINNMITYTSKKISALFYDIFTSIQMAAVGTHMYKVHCKSSMRHPPRSPLPPEKILYATLALVHIEHLAASNDNCTVVHTQDNMVMLSCIGILIHMSLSAEQ